MDAIPLGSIPGSARSRRASRNSHFQNGSRRRAFNALTFRNIYFPKRSNNFNFLNSHGHVPVSIPRPHYQAPNIPARLQAWDEGSLLRRGLAWPAQSQFWAASMPACRTPNQCRLRRTLRVQNQPLCPLHPSARGRRRPYLKPKPPRTFPKLPARPAHSLPLQIRERCY